MLGILLVLIIQGPFANGPKCNYNQTNQTDSVKNKENNSFIDDQKYFLFAVFFTVIFIIGGLLVLIFVNEKNGNQCYLKQLKINVLFIYIKISL